MDECQDFTPADFKMLACLAPDPNRFVVAGDESQSMHLGTSYRRPGFRTRRWLRRPLRGSYRLPLRVWEAVTFLADALREHHTKAARQVTTEAAIDLDLVDPSSMKSAVLGVRPLILSAGEHLRDHLAQVLSLYEPVTHPAGLPTAPITLAERDDEVMRTLTALGFDAAEETMLKIKGLERPWVVWSTRSSIESDESLAEYVFTILTRTTSLLILVLWPDQTPPQIKALVGRLRRDRVLFWDEKAERTFDSFADSVGTDSDPLL